MAAYRDKSDLISIGAYARGSDPLIDAAIDARGAIDGFLKQGVTELSTAAEADSAVTNLSLLAGLPEPGQPVAVADPPVTAAPAAPAAQPAMPLHSAIPPLHLAS